MDALFVIRKSILKESANINSVLENLYGSFEHKPELVFFSKESLGFSNNTPVLIEGHKLHDYLERHIVYASKQIEALSKSLLEAKFKEEKGIKAQIKAVTDIQTKLIEWAQESAKNSIVHNFSTNMLDMKNRSDLLTPISFEDVVGNKEDLRKALAEDLTTTDFLRTLAASELIELKC